MLYLSGVTNDRVQARLVAAGVGVLLQPRTGYVERARAFPAFAADNGCFSMTYDFDEGRWFRWLQGVPRLGCVFAGAPDVVSDHYATRERSGPWLERIREAGFPAAFVGQNGAHTWNMPWDDFDVLFLGGSPECLPCGYIRPVHEFGRKRCPFCDTPLVEWKLGKVAALLTAAAKRRGKWVHMGRVNSCKRLKYADAIGCDSADGTFLAYGPDKNLPQLEGWLRQVSAPQLFPN